MSRSLLAEAPRPLASRPRVPLPGRLRPAHWVAIDAIFAAVLLAIVVRGASPENPDIPRWVATAAITVTTLPLGVRRLWPLPVFGTVLVASTALMLLAGARSPHLQLAIAIYPVVVQLPRRTAIGALAAALAAIPVGVLPAPGWEPGAGSPIGLMISSSILIIGVWVVGFAVREQRAYTAKLREIAAREAVAQERLRIARELHDVVAHGMAVIAVQAGVANYVVEEQPEEARRALSSIEDASRTGLQELRYMLSALRSDGEYESPQQSSPGLAGLGPLVSRFTEAGLPVRPLIRGAGRPLPPAIDQSAYRIVQEALTNVVKHAGRATAELTVDVTPDEVRIEVVDDGVPRLSGPEAGGGGPGNGMGGLRPGHGIIGMQERVAVFGGELEVGPLQPPAAGFRVCAVIPLAEASV